MKDDAFRKYMYGRFGKTAFDKYGNIKPEYARKVLREYEGVKRFAHIVRMANFFLNTSRVTTKTKKNILTGKPVRKNRRR